MKILSTSNTGKYRNRSMIAIEIYEFLQGLSAAITGVIIKLITPPTYNLRTRHELHDRTQKQ